MSFARPTLSQLIERARDDVNGRFPGADSRLRRSALGALAVVHAGAMHGLYGYLDDIALQILPDTADAEHLQRWATIFGVTRKPAAAATGAITVTGTNGTVIASGKHLQRGDEVAYTTTSGATIAGGVATLNVQADAPGAMGAAIAGVALEFTSPIAGVNTDAVVAAGGLTGALDEETDTSLRARLLDRIRQPPNGGSESDYERWALEYPEVTRAWVYPEASGVGTVGILFVMDGRVSIFPLSGDITGLAAYIADRRPVTAQVTVAGPANSAQAFSITLTPNTALVQAAVTAALKDLFQREGEPGGTILISHVREAISTAAGEADHVLTAPTANIVASAGQLKTVGVITFS
jgi:uncharacterized phage protein gp47/JayE